ncbi:hypothetical protein [Micromonospora eburnea]|uniref:Uncharacterized protein n=1 Tax=Micromonospora eburnea TaxID=227316 RepID=A0A1C6VJU5_9ACTN|nr:hypothetical protein [Micromonospora eburnea]SCL66190.1 hypothetical protein GA0070604_5609 [Micromonospora eburnea]
MAFRTWSRLLLTALGASVLAGAGQLGIAYGFGVVRLDGAFTDGAINRWPAQLAWVGWFAAVAAVAGAVGTERLARRDGIPGGTTEQLSVAGAAALGAAVVAPLCMQPARTAELGGTVDPVWAVGICAILGALIGAGAAIVVLLKPPFGWNIALTAGAVWLLALISAAPSVSSAGPLVTVRLGVLEPSWLDAATAQRLAMLLLPLLALLAGAAVGALARRRGHLPLVGGAAGAAGPVLLAFAYLTAGPGNAADRYQLAPYYAALIAVAAGALGSTATTVLRRPAAEPETAALEPTDILQPLPPSPATPGSDSGRAAPADQGVGVRVDLQSDGNSLINGVGRRAAETIPTAAAAPAHWDWPVPSGLAPARKSGAARTAPGHTTAEARQAAAAPISLADHPTSGVPASAEPAATQHPTSGVPASAEPAATQQNPGEHPSAEAIPAADHPTSGVPASAEPAAGQQARADEPEPMAGPTVAQPAAPPRTTDAADTDEPVADQEADALARNLPVPGLLPPGRRTSAIDVLAAGRPAPQPPAEPGISAPDPAPASAAADPGPASGSGSDSPVAAGPDSPVAGDADPASTQPRPDGRSRRGRGVRTGPATTAADAPPIEATPTEATPTGATPTEAAPTEPTPTEAAPTEPTPTEAAPTEPTSVEETPAEPKPVEETPAEPAPVEPIPAQAAMARTAPAQAVPAKANPVEPATGQAAPAETALVDPHTAAPAVEGVARSALPAPRPADGPGQVTGTRTPAPDDAPAPAADGGRGTPNYFFSDDDEPVAGDHLTPVEAPESPRPRFPIFEDVADRPNDPLPAWPGPPPPGRPATTARNEPAVPAPSQPRSPFGNNGSAGGVTSDPTGISDRNGAPTAEARIEPAPHPRHRSLPDLGREARWDAFANARRVTPVIPNGPLAGGQHAAAGEPVVAGSTAKAEPGGGKPKVRRGLFRRNRARDGGLDDTGRSDHESEQLATQDEEYVDWVAGLASDADGEGPRTPRTGRHHRD